MPINGGMMPWDYYQASLENAQRSDELAARMEQLRTAQIRQQILSRQHPHLLPMRMSLTRPSARMRAPQAPVAPPVSPVPPHVSMILQHAEDAIGQGADPAAIFTRLQALQIDPSPLVARLLSSSAPVPSADDSAPDQAQDPAASQADEETIS